MFKRLFLILCCYQLGLVAQAADDKELALIPSAPEYVASLSGSPTSLIAGNVSPVTGSLLISEADVVARGAQPIEIHRYFCSGTPATYPNINPNRADYLAYKNAPVFGGWSFLQHRHLNAYQDHSGCTIITLSQPNGLTLNYQVEPSGETQLISRPVGLHNFGPDGPSGRYHLSNTYFEISPSLKTITAYLPEGVMRTYVYLRGSTFCLQSERLPNGRHLHYEYDSSGKLLRIYSSDPDSRQTYASVDIRTDGVDYTFVTNTGLATDYKCQWHHFDRKWKEGKGRNAAKISVSCNRPFLSQVNSPFFRRSKASYAPRLQLQEYSGKTDWFQCHWATQKLPTGSHVVGLAALLEPIGEEGDFVATSRFEYERGVPGTRGGWTKAIHPDGTAQIYHYSPSFYLTRIEHLEADGTLRFEERYCWSEKGFLTSTGRYDSRGQPLWTRTYKNDAYGNPIEEHLTGDLSGGGAEETYSITREYSADGRHLVLRESEGNGLTTLYGYVTNTSLPSFKLVCDRETILRRTFWEYDDSLNLIQITKDDGSSSDRTRTIGVTERRWTRFILRQESPFIHMPEYQEEWCLQGGKEVLLRRIHLAYDLHGRVCAETVYDAEGTLAYVIERDFDEAGNVLRETNPLGQEAHHTYDKWSRKTESHHFCGTLATERAYDRAGRLTTQVEVGSSSARQQEYSYDERGRLISEHNHLGHPTYHTYDPVTGVETQETTPLIADVSGAPRPVVSCNILDPFGQPIHRIDPCGHTTSRSFNARGSPTQIVHPNGSTETFRYFLDGTLREHVSPCGLITQYRRDVLGRAVAKVARSPSGDVLSSESWEYSGVSLISETDRGGFTTTYAYDGAGREVERSREGKTVRRSYDSLGRLSQRIQLNDEQTLITSYSYDAADRLVEESARDLDGTLLRHSLFDYDPRGNKCAIHRWIDDSAISTDRYEYDCFDQLICSVDPLGNVTTISYNEDSVDSITGLRQRTKITRQPAGRIETVTYNAYNRPALLQLSDPEGRSLKTSSFAYDLSLNLVQKRDQNRLTTWTYDWAGRITTETLAANCSGAATTNFKYTHSGKLASKVKPSGEAIHYEYDYLDNLIHLEGPGVSYQYEYDSLGYLSRAADALNGSSIIRTVDPSGNLTCERLASGKVIRKSYDKRDRPLSLTLPDRSEVRFSYDPLHPTSIERYDANGVCKHSHTYDEYNLLGLIASETAADGSHTTYTYDPKGRPTSKSNPFLSIAVNKYTADDCPCNVTEDGNEIHLDYDALCQLTEEPEHSHEFSPLYNPVSTVDQAIEVNALDQLVSFGNVQCTYDADGRLVHKGDTTFTYNALDQLVAAKAPHLSVEFSYDPLGRRTTKTVEDRRGWIGTATHHESYLYDGDQEIGTISEDGHIEQLRVGLGGRPSVAIELNGIAYSPLSDLRGNVRTLAAIETGNIADSYQYTAFAPTTPLPSLSNPWRFAGKRMDDELGLVYFGKRYYDPQLARWLTPDPVGILKAHNLYAYCLNNPWLYTDPDGEFIFLIAIPLGSFALSAIVTTSAYATAAALVTWGFCEANQYIERRARHRVFVNTINATYARQTYSNSTTESKRKKKRGGAFPDRPLPLTEDGVFIPDVDVPHTQLGTRTGRRGSYPQAREFDGKGQVIRDIDFTDHGRPNDHTNPHQHIRIPNPTGGTPQRDLPKPLE